MEQVKPPLNRRLSAGSLNAMRLGAQTLDDLAALVNWGNAQDFTPPQLTPWVEIEGNEVGFEVKPANPPSADDVQATAGETSEGHEKVAADGASEADTQVASAMKESMQGEISAVAEDHEHDHEHDHEIAGAGDGVHDEQQTDSEEAAEIGVDRERVDEAEPIADSPVPLVARAKPPVKQRVVTTAGEPRMPSSPSAVAVDSAYLRRLESLVLNLNGQLAQQASRARNAPLDELTWLRQRVIELSLDNLELREQLTTRKR